MARPLKEGMDYFPHDTDAVDDEKIDALRAVHGNDGYAFYFILLERVYRTANAELDVSKPAVLAALIHKVGVSPEKFQEMLQTAFDVGCFDQREYETRRVLTSNGIKKRAFEIQKMRERWRKQKNSQEGDPGHGSGVFPMENPVDNPGENAEETPESKEKKSKENNISSSLLTPPPLQGEGEQEEKEQIDLIDPIEGQKNEVCKFATNQFVIGAGKWEIDKLTSWIDDGMGGDAVIYAMEVAILANKRRFDYVMAVLQDWFKAGVRTRQQAEELIKQRRARAQPEKGKGKGNSSGGIKYYDAAEELAKLKRRTGS